MSSSRLTAPGALALAAAGVLGGCYASHELPEDAPDAGPRPTGVCRLEPGTCEVDADCGGSPPWACREGRCELVGCRSDADCRDDRHVCLVEDGYGQCYERCESVRDCHLISSFAGDAECRGGLCRPAGCPSDAWCEETWGASDGQRYRCERRPGIGLGPEGDAPRCWAVCEVDGDCVPGPGGIPEWCLDGYCLVGLCRSDDQCRRWFDERSRCVER